MEEIIFKRKIYDRLLSWKKKSAGKKALLIEGARRVGKTTIAKEFGEREYSSYIYIDFSRGDPLAEDLFRDMSNMDTFYSRLFLYAGKTLAPREGLIILDEIQFAPRARMAIKALCEDGRYDVIEAGSLLSLKHRKKKMSSSQYMVPSEEQRIEMFPLDFEEFCLAFGDDPSIFETLRSIASDALLLSAIDQVVHRRWMEKVRLYVALGGMPAVIAAFKNTNSFYDAHLEKIDIVKLYRDDLGKLDRDEDTLCREVYDDIHDYMKEDSSRFRINGLFGDGRSNLLSTTLTNLSDSKTAIIVNACLDPSPGMGLAKDEKKFKVYANDVGLFSVLYLESAKENDVLDYYRRLIFGKLDANLGPLYEHFVLENLLASGSLPYYHSFSAIKDGKEKKYEIDFMLYHQGKIVPVEVKAGRTFSASSLNAFKEKYSSRVLSSYILSPRMPKREDGIIYLPLYFAGVI